MSVADTSCASVAIPIAFTDVATTDRGGCKRYLIRTSAAMLEVTLFVYVRCIGFEPVLRL